MTRYLTLLWTLAIAVTAAGLFHISYRVEAMESRLAGLNGRIVAEQEAIRVLRADWAWLDRPDRLERLVAERTALRPMTPDQIIAGADVIPAPLPGLADPDDAEALMTLVTVEGFGDLPMPPRRPSARGTAAAPAATASVPTPAGGDGAAVPASTAGDDPVAGLIRAVDGTAEAGEGTR